MPKQDPRITVDALDAVAEFHSAVADNDNDMVRGFLEMEPTLIYARDELGNTALNDLIIGGTQADLETLRVILDVARENGVLPDLFLENNRGHNVYHAFQVHMEGGAEYTDLNEEFIKLVDPEYHARLIAKMEEEYATTDSPDDSTDSIEKLRAEEDSHFKGNKNHALMKKMGDGAKIYTALVEEQTYGDELKEIFSRQSMFYNFDDQKSLNQMDAEVNALLRDISFSPSSSFILSLESDSLLILPQNLGEVFNKIYEYIFGNLDHQ